MSENSKNSKKDRRPHLHIETDAASIDCRFDNLPDLLHALELSMKIQSLEKAELGPQGVQDIHFFKTADADQSLNNVVNDALNQIGALAKQVTVNTFQAPPGEPLSDKPVQVYESSWPPGFGQTSQLLNQLNQPSAVEFCQGRNCTYDGTAGRTHSKECMEDHENTIGGYGPSIPEIPVPDPTNQIDPDRELGLPSAAPMAEPTALGFTPFSMNDPGYTHNIGTFNQATQQVSYNQATQPTAQQGSDDPFAKLTPDLSNNAFAQQALHNQSAVPANQRTLPTAQRSIDDCSPQEWDTANQKVRDTQSGVLGKTDRRDFMADAILKTPEVINQLRKIYGLLAQHGYYGSIDDVDCPLEKWLEELKQRATREAASHNGILELRRELTQVTQHGLTLQHQIHAQQKMLAEKDKEIKLYKENYEKLYFHFRTLSSKYGKLKVQSRLVEKGQAEPLKLHKARQRIAELSVELAQIKETAQQRVFDALASQRKQLAIDSVIGHHRTEEGVTDFSIALEIEGIRQHPNGLKVYVILPNKS